MNRLQLTTTGVWLAFFVAACSSSESSGNGNTVGGSSSSNSTSTGGSQNTSSSSTKSTGGSSSSATTGTKATGGASATGGKSATGGGSATGGKSATGGGSATGGKSATGGGSATGGKSATGGGSAVGGQSTTGGQSTAGGATGAGGTSGSTAGSSSSGQTGGTTTAGGSSTAGGSAATGGTSAAQSSAPEVPQVITSDQTNFWKTGTYTDSTGTADITVGSSGGQNYIGFGGTFNEVGWDVMKSLTDADRAAIIKALFSADEGINFAWGRIPIGASDYALTWYSLDETANDTAMSSFSIEKDKANLIPYINAALDVKSDIKFWASPWTPPSWMKSNNSLDAVSNKSAPYQASDGYMKSDDANLTAFALYLKKFVQAYDGLTPKIKISAIVPQNEPGYGNPYPSCYWDSATYVKFVGKFMGPLFASDLPDTDIWAGTMSKETDGTIAENAWADSTAKTYLKGSALQWNTFSNVGNLKGKGTLVMSEHKCGNYNFDTATPKNDVTWKQNQYNATKPANDYAYGIESWYLIRDWIQAGVNSYNAWNMVLDTNGLNNNSSNTKWPQDALIVVDKAAKKYTLTPAYYVFRHVSQYLKLPATLINTTGDYLAFKNSDGSYVVVVYNKGAAKNMTVSVNNKKLQFAAPGNGWATINVPK